MRNLPALLLLIASLILVGCSDDEAISNLHAKVDRGKEQLEDQTAKLEEAEREAAALQAKIVALESAHREELAGVVASRDQAQANLDLVTAHLETRHDEWDAFLERLTYTDPDFSEIGMMVFSLQVDQVEAGIQDVLKLREILELPSTTETEQGAGDQAPAAVE